MQTHRSSTPSQFSSTPLPQISAVGVRAVQPPQAPLPQKPVEGNIDVDDDHAAARFQQMHVVDHLGAAAVHVEDRLAHQVLVEHDPAGLVDEGRILVAALGRLDEDGVDVDLDDPVTGDQLGRLSPTVL